jgi:UDP-N-acetylmuramoyl-tripeptide--D-alanyl-D-alanine ligase
MLREQTMQNSLVSVIVCTYNRCALLAHVLEDLAQQETEGRFKYEVIVVDNNSDDRTKETILAFSARPERSLEGGLVPAVAAAEIEDLGLDGTRATVRMGGETVSWRLPLLGRANLMNSLAAAAVGLEFGISPAEMAARVATMAPAAHRGEVLRLSGGVTVVDDAYNSNPRALKAALGVLAAETRHRRRVAVLGEMLELGETSRVLHQECGRAAAAAGLSGLIAVGGEAARALAEAAVAAGMPAGHVRHVATSEEAAPVAAAAVRAGDLVLVKGSRGIHTERVVERLSADFGSGQARP